MRKHKYHIEATELDRIDPLKEFRKEFVSDDDSVIYLDGNSLGRLPLTASERINTVVNREWGGRMIRSWNENWWKMPLRAASRISKIIGAKENEVIVCDSTSLNLYKLASAALKLNKSKKKIISEEISFPGDLYILQGLIDHMDEGHKLELAASNDGMGIDYAEFERLIDNNTALLVLSLVSFKSARMHNMHKITELAHKFGALVIWDLCHAAGAVPVDLNASNSDMAVGCTYKYLNCGPGSPAYLYVREDLQAELVSPIWAWFGDKSPFDFNLQYQASESIRKYMSGTSAILSMCTIEPAVDILLRAGINGIREKSIRMTDFFIRMYHDFLENEGYQLGSPENHDIRGSHISLKHPDAYRISKALIDPSCGNITIIPDYRPPENLRFGFAPLYNTFSEIVSTVAELCRIVQEDEISSYNTNRDEVT